MSASFRLVSLFACAALLLSACSSRSGSIGAALDDRRNAGPCPTAGALYDASRIIEFAGEAERYPEITYTGEISGVRLYCRYVGDEPILAEVEVDFAFGKGPQGTERYHDYNYYVTVMRRNSRVLNRETFTVQADFRDKQVTAVRDLVGRITIPRLDDTISGANFEVLVGFELTDAQLQFNRDGKRFRLDAGN
ncbi:MAG: hypothetical protein AAF742_09260 [Pseudomonadota bacterium]